MSHPKDDEAFLTTNYTNLRALLRTHTCATLPPLSAIQTAILSLPPRTQTPSPNDDLPSHGASSTLSTILTDVVPALTGQALSGRYFGFVTGGTHPAAEAADNIVSALDQNVQVHLPSQTVCTAVEDAALRMLVQLLRLGDPDAEWPGRTFTTGATASNIMGLACGREAVLQRRLEEKRAGGTALDSTAVAEMGLLAACRAAGVDSIQVLTSMGHSSLSKAASIVGIGHAAVKELPVSADEPWLLDLEAVERELARPGVANIIVVSAGEVNTGKFATKTLDMPKLRSLADRYGAWIHVDGAFGIFARVLPEQDEFLALRAITAGLEVADSITADGHKLLNVPYDCGVFLCRSSTIQSQVFSNPNAAYLAAPKTNDNVAPILSPLNIGMENSRRFRALPVYTLLRSEGRAGMEAMFVRMVQLARGIAEFVRDSEHYEWLPEKDAPLDMTHIIVLFRARDPKVNETLVERINESRKMYVSGTKWKGEKACRVAVSSWRVDVEKDLAIVKEVLLSVATQG